MKKILPTIVLAPFALFCTVVIVEHGYLGFITLSLREPWALQMLIDLSITLFLFGGWMRRDARALGIPVLPYLLLLPLVGSISALGYLVHRGLVIARARARASTPSTASAA